MPATPDIPFLEVQLRLAQSRLAAAENGAAAQLAALAAERDALASSGAAATAEAAALTAERNWLASANATAAAQLETLAGERDRLAGEAAALATQRDAVTAQLEAVAAQRDAISRERDAIAAAAQPDAQAAAPPPPQPVRRRVARRFVLALWRLVRPLLRPPIWRLRTFLVGDLTHKLDARTAPLPGLLAELRHVLQSMSAPGTLPAMRAADNAALVTEVGRIAAAASDQNSAVLAELRQLADEMGRVVLTLALEPPPPPPPPLIPAAAPAPATLRAPLLLPDGGTAEIVCLAADRSLGAALTASGGDWEPHVRRYLAATVQPDWTCLDIGANLGAHTLALAVLAQRGRVVAFEADPVNHALLCRNADALAPPKAPVEALAVALWDRPGRLIIGGADELAGCAFVAEPAAADPADTERRLRSVVDAAAIADTALHVRLSEVPAVTLDDWVAAQDLDRLDFIKLDVEGAETHVLRGAVRSLARYRPVLLVEYNPACAAAYFGEAATALFDVLAAQFATLNALEPDGTLTPLAGWPALAARLAAGRGWEDLVCLPG